MTFALYTTQIVQLLDLALFRIFKRKEKYYLPFGDLGTTINFGDNVCMKMAKILIPLPLRHMGRISGDWN
jgi:hypothetical protein